MSTKLRWLASPSASCFHAVAALVASRPLAEERLSDALAPGAGRLRAELSGAGIPAAAFFAQLVPLSATIESNRQLAETTLVKVAGRVRATPLVSEFAGLLGDLEHACFAAQPELSNELELRSGPLREQWEARGPGLLMGIARRTDPELLVEQADAILVHPALGGAGTAHLHYNSVRIEAVLANPLATLPEVARLGWLVSQLNLDLPRYSESINRSRLSHLASLATLPAALAAAADVELLADSDATWRQSLSAWFYPDQGDATADVLRSWWETFQSDPPPWPVALAALDQMLP